MKSLFYLSIGIIILGSCGDKGTIEPGNTPLKGEYTIHFISDQSFENDTLDYSDIINYDDSAHLSATFEVQGDRMITEERETLNGKLIIYRDTVFYQLSGSIIKVSDEPITSTNDLDTFRYTLTTDSLTLRYSTEVESDGDVFRSEFIQRMSRIQ